MDSLPGGRVVEAPTIEAQDLTKTYGDVHAVVGVSFRVERGEIFGFLGRNGSGKTTTVRMLTTLTTPTSGSASVAGIDVLAQPRDVRARIGVTMQDAALDPQMTGLEHLEFIAGILGLGGSSGSARVDELLELFELGDPSRRAISTYSGGMKRRLDIATALLGEPKILFLDEPTTGLDPQSRRVLWQEIRNLKGAGATVFLTTQYLEEADFLSDHLAIIDSGEIIATGTANQLRHDFGRKRISFGRNGLSREELAHHFRLVDSEISIDADRVHIETAPNVADRELIELLGQVAEYGGVSSGIEVVDTSLEDVFLRLTGTAITESTEAREEASA